MSIHNHACANVFFCLKPGSSLTVRRMRYGGVSIRPNAPISFLQWPLVGLNGCVHELWSMPPAEMRTRHFLGSAAKKLGLVPINGRPWDQRLDEPNT